MYCIVHTLCTVHSLCTSQVDSWWSSTSKLAACYLWLCLLPQSSYTSIMWLAGTVRGPTCWSSSCFFLPTPQPHWALSLRGPFCSGMSTHQMPTMASTSSESTPPDAHHGFYIKWVNTSQRVVEPVTCNYMASCTVPCSILHAVIPTSAAQLCWQQCWSHVTTGLYHLRWSLGEKEGLGGKLHC